MNKRLIVILIAISIFTLVFAMAPIPPPPPPPPPPPTYDCSPGYWKNHTENWGPNYDPGDPYNGSMTLLDALQGGKHTRVSRFEVAGLLNSDPYSIKCKD
jgi:hypothetical protein